MAERRLDQVDRTAALERVRGVGVAQPMRRDLLVQPGLEAGARRRLPHQALDRRWVQVATVPRAEDGIISTGAAAERDQLAPQPVRQQHYARLGPLAKHGHLPTVIPGLQVAPVELGDLRYAQAC